MSTHAEQMADIKTLTAELKAMNVQVVAARKALWQRSDAVIREWVQGMVGPAA